jgi:hypothetical protein
VDEIAFPEGFYDMGGIILAEGMYDWGRGAVPFFSYTRHMPYN